MTKNFDSIDIILIVLISFSLLVILIGVMWIFLSKIEKIEIEKKGSSKLSSDTKFDKLILNNEENISKSNSKNSSQKKTQKTKGNIQNNKQKKNLNVKKKTQVKNNSSKRSNGYVSPTKRKKSKTKKK